MLYCNRETASGFSSAPDMYIARGGLAGLRGPSNLFSSWEIYFTAYCSVFRVKCYRCTHVHPTWPFLFAAPTRDSGDRWHSQLFDSFPNVLALNTNRVVARRTKVVDEENEVLRGGYVKLNRRGALPKDTSIKFHATS